MSTNGGFVLDLRCVVNRLRISIVDSAFATRVSSQVVVEGSIERRSVGLGNPAVLWADRSAEVVPIFAAEPDTCLVG
jgi:hypothetical protein